MYSVEKSKDHKKYGFGAKASVAVTKNSSIIVGAVSHPKNVHDSKTLLDVIGQSFLIAIMMVNKNKSSFFEYKTLFSRFD